MAEKRIYDYIAETGITLEEITAIFPDKDKVQCGLDDSELARLKEYELSKAPSTGSVATEDKETDEEAGKQPKPSETPNPVVEPVVANGRPEGVTDLQWLILGTAAKPIK